jgi:hypothetical protein
MKHGFQRTRLQCSFDGPTDEVLLTKEGVTFIAF